MKLTPEQKRSLKDLTTHPGYKVLQDIEKEAKLNLAQFLLTANLDDAEQMHILKKNQTYNKAREDFFQNVELHIAEIYTPNI